MDKQMLTDRLIPSKSLNTQENLWVLILSYLESLTLTQAYHYFQLQEAQRLFSFYET